MFIFFSLCPCVAFPRFSLVPFVPSLFFLVCRLSQSLLSFTVVWQQFWSQQREKKKKTSASIDLATSCFPLRVFVVILSCFKIFPGHVCTRTTLTPCCFHAALFFFVVFFAIDWGCVSSKTPILPPFSHSGVGGWRLASQRHPSVFLTLLTHSSYLKPIETLWSSSHFTRCPPPQQMAPFQLTGWNHQLCFFFLVLLALMLSSSFWPPGFDGWRSSAIGRAPDPCPHPFAGQTTSTLRPGFPPRNEQNKIINIVKKSSPDLGGDAPPRRHNPPHPPLPTHPHTFPSTVTREEPCPMETVTWRESKLVTNSSFLLLSLFSFLFFFVCVLVSPACEDAFFLSCTVVWRRRGSRRCHHIVDTP